MNSAPALVPTAANNTVGEQPFVVTHDGQRFLVLTPIEKTTNQPLEVLVNWR